MESIDLIPMDGDVSKITRRAEEFRDLPEALQRNLQTFLTLTMDALAGVHQKIKGSFVADANKQIVSRFPSRDILQRSDVGLLRFTKTLAALKKKSRSLMIFGGILKYRMSPDVYSYLARLDVEIAL